jgi:hypothetical protein
MNQSKALLVDHVLGRLNSIKLGGKKLGSRVDIRGLHV